MTIPAIPVHHPAAVIADPGKANSLGMKALHEGAPEQALFYFARAIALDAQAGALWRNLATACRAVGDDAGERDALEGALGCDRTDFMAWLRKAELHERRDEKSLALEAWSGVAQMAGQFDPIPEGLVSAIAHARDYVARFGTQLSEALDRELGGDVAQMAETSSRRMGAFIDRASGKRRIYQNECAGLYYPFLPADEFFDRHHFPWFDALESQTAAIREELLALLKEGSEAMRPYVRMDKGTPQSKWTALDHSLDWTAIFLWEYGEPNLAVLDRCPLTRAAIEAVPQAMIPGRSPSVFFSILKPQTHIPPHTGVTNSRAIIHLPLIVPDNCGFRVGGETREWVEGRAFAFDDTIEHEAWNRSDDMRAVLILDVWNPHIGQDEQAMIVRFFETSDRATGAA